MTSSSRVTYGARPVSLDLTRGRALHEPTAAAPIAAPGRPTAARVIDQLALAHWPSGHRVVICGLDGGTGRSSVAALFAAALVDLPYAHVHKPVALLELQPRMLSTTRRRWMAESVKLERAPRPAVDQYRPPQTRSGIVLPRLIPAGPRRTDYSVVVVEAPVGLPSEHDVVSSDPTASVVLVLRPDRRSLADAADALVWMHDQGLVHRSRVVVVVNLAAGQVDRGSRASSTALAMRCRAVHRLSYNDRLGPMACLPSGTALAPSLRRPISEVCLDVYHSSQIAADASVPHPEESS